MLNCKVLSRGLRKVEFHIKLVVIPFFALTMLYMTMDFCAPDHYFPYFVTNLIGIMLGWYIGRTIIFKLKKKMPKRTGKRLAVQLIFSIVAAFVFVIIYIYIKGFFFDKHDVVGFVTNDPVFKIISGVSIVYMFLLNAMYECFFLFSELSETMIETEKYKKANAEAQLKNLTSKLNPHFLFNSLNTLITIIEENKEKAVDYVQEVSNVYRYVLNSEKYTWVTLEDEIQFSVSYISLLKMRFETNFNVEFDIDESRGNTYILPLTIQLLVENAIKHNEISDHVHLNIRIVAQDGWLTVINNVNHKKINENNSTKIGLKNIKERYWLLTKKDVIIKHERGHFSVKIPLLNLKNAPDESFDHRR